MWWFVRPITFAALAYVAHGWGSSPNSGSEAEESAPAVAGVPSNFYVLGIDPAQTEYFYTAKSGGKFSCMDSSETVPWDAVNDNYCDCADGSDEPGTSACPDSTFFCRNEGGSDWTTETFPSSQVSDGVCDCCDGSDEPNRLPTCPNVCKKRSLQNRLKIKKMAKRHAKGYKGRKNRGSLKSLKKQFLAYKEKQLTGMEADETSAIVEMKKMKGYFQTASKAGSGIDPRAYQYASHLQQTLRGIAFHKNMLEQLQSKQLGSRMEFFPMLVSKCIRSEYINEKRFKGGTPNVVPQTYQIELCPFRTVSLMEINHTVWEQKEDHVKHGGRLANFVLATAEPEAAEPLVEVAADGSTESTKESSEPSAGIQRNKFGDEETGKTLLGVWQGWEAKPAGRRNTFSTMLFRDGEKCADGIGTKGHKRLADIQVRCGVEEKIVDAIENVCHYSMILETPAACSLKQSKELKGSL
jgi:hypothetical protein